MSHNKHYVHAVMHAFEHAEKMAPVGHGKSAFLAFVLGFLFGPFGVGGRAMRITLTVIVAAAVLTIAGCDRDASRIAGVWHPEGTFTDWRFEKDGRFLEEGIFTTRGTYEVLPGSRLRISVWTGDMNFEYEFRGSQLVLKPVEGTVFGFTLLRR